MSLGRLTSALLLSAAKDETGIYPAAVDGVKRTEWQDGWNACATGLSRRHRNFVAWFESLDEHMAMLIEEMLAADAISLWQTQLCILPCFNSSDLFAWGYSDSEPIATPQMLNDVHIAWRNHPAWGMCAWLCIRENQKPQWPVEEDMRKSGAWLPVMDGLAPNKYDEHIKRWESQSYEEAVAAIAAQEEPHE